MAGPGDGPPGKDEEGRQLLQVSAAPEETCRALGANSARSLRCRWAGGLLFGLLAAVALLVVYRPAPAASSATAASGAGPTAAVEGDALGLAELQEGVEQAPGREALEVANCKYSTRRRRADRCTACDSGPLPDPGCGPLAMHTDGFYFTFSVEVTLLDLPKEGADIIKSSTGGFRFAVEGSEEKRGLVVFEFKPLNKPLSHEEAEELEDQMKARGEAWEEMTSTPMPKKVNDLHTKNYYWKESALSYGYQNRRLQDGASDFFGNTNYQQQMFQVYSAAPLSKAATFIITVTKTQSSLCMSTVPKGSDWHPLQVCTKALYAETEAYMLYQMLPPGDLYWAKDATPGVLLKKQALKAEKFRLLNDSLPFTYSVVGVDYADLVKADAIDKFNMGMKEGISIDTGVPIDSISLSSAVDPLHFDVDREASVVNNVFQNSKVPSIHVSVTLHAIGGDGLALQEKVRSSAHLETSIAVRVTQVLGALQSGQVLVVNLEVPPRSITKCGSFRCPALSKPDTKRSCIGGDCSKVCCTVDATCAEYKGCKDPYYKKKLSLFRKCWGEKQCAEVCCERSCSNFKCGAYWEPIKEKHETYCDKQPKWMLKCNGTAYGSDANCGDQCCYQVKPTCCTDKNLAFCRACQTCTSRESYCKAHGKKTNRRLEELQNATASSNSGGLAKPKNLLQSAKKEPSQDAPVRELEDGKLRGCKAYPKQNFQNPLYYGVEVKDCSAELQVKFTLHSKKGPAGVMSVKVLPDTVHVVSGGEDGNAWVWSLKTGEPMSVYDQGGGKTVRAVAAMADGIHAVSGGDDGTVHVWTWRDAFTRNHFQVVGKASGVSSEGPAWDYPIDAAILGLDNQVQWSVVAIASADGYFRIFDFRHGNVARLPKTAKSEEEIKNYWKATFDMAADREIGGLSGTDRWRLEQTEDSSNPRENVPPAFKPPGDQKFGTSWGRATSVTYVPATMNCAVGYEDGMVRYWNAYSFGLISEFGPGRKAGPILTIMAMQTAPYVFTGGMDGMLRKFHVPSGEQVWEVDIGYGGAVRSLTVVPVSSKVITGSDDGYIRMYDGGSGNPVCQQNTGGGRVNSVDVNPGKLGQYIVGNQDGVARVFR